MTLSRMFEAAFAKHTVPIAAGLLAAAAVVGWYLGGLGGKKPPVVSGLARHGRRKFR